MKTGLADRVRAVIGGSNAAGRSPDHASTVYRTDAPPAPETIVPSAQQSLGGTWFDEQRRCLVVERSFDSATRHGSADVGTCARWIDESRAGAALFATGVPSTPRFAFFDLETTGLSGGAGTLAFLVGCGWFDGGALRIRQFLMVSPVHERALLDGVSRELAQANVLVSFNGKSFDAPLLEARCMYHRLPWTRDDAAHLDALHAARRFWGPRRATAADAALPSDGCTLTALEREVLGYRRRGDVPRLEIPARYFRFLRTGDPQPLAAVLDHNRLDLLTLAALTARLLWLTAGGAARAANAREAYALGVTYARAGRTACADGCFRRAIELSRAPAGAVDPLRIDACRALAILARRDRRFGEAAAFWRQVVSARGCPAAYRREAAEALAIHHEHRVRDLEAAKAFAMESLLNEPRPRWNAAVQYRLARIERKMNGKLM
jgi:uncharacterized protein YprB with RNaseH-like and TPR domain